MIEKMIQFLRRLDFNFNLNLLVRDKLNANSGFTNFWNPKIGKMIEETIEPRVDSILTSASTYDCLAEGTVSHQLLQTTGRSTGRAHFSPCCRASSHENAVEVLSDMSRPNPLLYTRRESHAL